MGGKKLYFHCGPSKKKCRNVVVSSEKKNSNNNIDD